MKIRLFHVTNELAAAAILSGGFITPPQRFPFLGDMRGCFVSVVPLGIGEGAKGSVTLEIVIESTPEQMFYEWEIIAGQPYREWCIPVEVLNSGTIRRLSEDEANAIEAVDCWNEYPPGEPEKTFAELEADPVEDID